SSHACLMLLPHSPAIPPGAPKPTTSLSSPSILNSFFAKLFVSPSTLCYLLPVNFGGNMKKLFPTICLMVLCAVSVHAQVDPKWKIHARTRRNPPIITSGTASTQDAPGKAPSDAIVLFDGKDLSKWVSKKDGSPAQWKVENGYFEVANKSGDIR